MAKHKIAIRTDTGRAIIALTGAVQAFERLGQESKEAESGDTTIRDQNSDQG